MRSRASSAAVLAICLFCHVAEIFDQGDHTLQTGDDTEYTFVVIALCAGIAYSLKWFVPPIALREIASKRLHRLSLFLQYAPKFSGPSPF